MLNWLKSAYDRASGAIDSTIRGWVHDVIAGLYSFLHTIFGDVRGAWNDLVGATEAIWHALDDFGSMVWGVFNDVIHHWIPDILSWINTDIVDPLLKAVAWIANEGVVIAEYLADPGKLVALIWDALIANLESTAWATATKLGQFAIALVWNNLSSFLTLIEDILDAIF